MDPALIPLIGFAAAALTTLAFLPQVLKVWRTQNVEGISMTTYGMLCLGIALWLAYGLLIGDGPIIAANLVTLTLVASVLLLAIRYRAR